MEVDIRINGGCIFLMIVSCYGYLDVVEFLIFKGVDLKFFDVFGWIVLYFVSLGGYVLVIRVFIKVGVDVNVCIIYGMIFFYIVVCYG